MQWSFERFEFEREDLRQDLIGLDLDLSKCRIGDFACGWGYITLGLMLELQCRECIGVDRFEKNPILDVPSIHDVQEQYNEIKNMVLQKTNSPQNNGVINDIHHLLSNECFPRFHTGDIVAGDNLPSELDVVYCKKLLQNVFEGGYSNSYQGNDGVRLAVEHIANAVKRGGLIILVEPAGTNFMTFLDGAGLELIRCCRIQRNEINGQKRNMIYKAPYLIYHYSKS